MRTWRSASSSDGKSPLTGQNPQLIAVRRTIRLPFRRQHCVPPYPVDGKPAEAERLFGGVEVCRSIAERNAAHVQVRVIGIPQFGRGVVDGQLHRGFAGRSNDLLRDGEHGCARLRPFADLDAHRDGLRLRGGVAQCRTDVRNRWLRCILDVYISDVHGRAEHQAHAAGDPAEPVADRQGVLAPTHRAGIAPIEVARRIGHADGEFEGALGAEVRREVHLQR